MQKAGQLSGLFFFLRHRYRHKIPAIRVLHATLRYTVLMQRKIFWLSWTALGLLADFTLPFWWAVAATIPTGVAAWWIAYRSDWF